jgi:hypothetical protein
MHSVLLLKLVVTVSDLYPYSYTQSEIFKIFDIYLNLIRHNLIIFISEEKIWNRSGYTLL